MVSRIYVEKKPGFDVEAQQLLHELRTILGIERLENLRLLNRDDAEGITEEALRDAAPPRCSASRSPTPSTPSSPKTASATVFGVEFLPGQFDQRADSASECIQLISQGERPEVRSAKILFPRGRPHQRRRGRHQALRHQPSGSARSNASPHATLRMEFRRPTLSRWSKVSSTLMPPASKRSSPSAA